MNVFIDAYKRDTHRKCCRKMYWNMFLGHINAPRADQDLFDTQLHRFAQHVAEILELCTLWRQRASTTSSYPWNPEHLHAFSQKCKSLGQHNSVDCMLSNNFHSLSLQAFCEDSFKYVVAVQKKLSTFTNLYLSASSEHGNCLLQCMQIAWLMENQKMLQNYLIRKFLLH